jgi:hypothetical protein
LRATITAFTSLVLLRLEPMPMLSLATLSIDANTRAASPVGDIVAINAGGCNVDISLAGIGDRDSVP